jgi:hypothetical protein
MERVQQEKEKLKKELSQMKSMHVYYEEKYQELISKYESTMKDKMTLKVEKERHLAKIKTLKDSIENMKHKMKGLLLEQSEKNFNNSAMNESFSMQGQSKIRKMEKSKTGGKENLSKLNKQEGPMTSFHSNKKTKTNPLLTPIPKELVNTFVNQDTGMPNETKPNIGVNLSLIKKIKVGISPV